MIQVHAKTSFGVLWLQANKWAGLISGNQDVSNSDTFGREWMRVPIPIPGTFRDLTLYSVESRLGDIIGTLQKNATSTALVATLPNTETTVSNPNDTVTVAAGDDIVLAYTGTAKSAPSGYRVGTSIVWVGAQNIYGLSGFPGTISAGSVFCGGAFGNGRFENVANQTAGSFSYSICAVPGAIRKICIKEWAVASGGSWTVKVLIDHVIQTGTVTLNDGDGFVVGDVDIRCELTEHVEIVLIRNTTGTSFHLSHVGVGIAYEGDDPDAFMFCGGSNVPVISASQDNCLWTDGPSATTDGLTSAPISEDTFITALYIALVDPSTPTSSWLARLQASGDPTAAAVTLLPGSATGLIEDIRVALSADDFVNMLVRPENNPSDGNFYWGLAASTVGPAPPTGTIGPLAWIHWPRRIP